jgi:hypothetical protein
VYAWPGLHAAVAASGLLAWIALAAVAANLAAALLRPAGRA